MLIASGAPLRRVNDLKAHTLLHSLARPDDWRDWLAAAGASGVDASRGLRFESSSLAYQAAMEGLGVGIGQMALVIDDLEAGSHVPAIDFVFQNGTAYYLTYSPYSAKSHRLVEFRDWIMAQAALYETQHRFSFDAGAKLKLGSAAAR
jgi:LysR family glycine cleavage system transcriptional activator